MSEEQMLDDLQRRFDEIASDVPDRARIGRDVLALADREPRSSRRRVNQLLGVAAVLILAMVVAARLTVGNSAIVIETEPAQLDPVDGRRPTTPAGSRIESEGLPLDLVIPEIAGGRWLIVSETTNILTLALVDAGETTPSRGNPTLRIALAEGDRASSIGDGLIRDLFDVDLVADGPAVLGGFDGRQLKLATRGGTDTIGFRLGTGLYIGASGVDRRYVVHLIDLGESTLVLWLDAPTDAFDGSLLEADRLFASIDLDR